MGTDWKARAEAAEAHASAMSTAAVRLEAECADHRAAADAAEARVAELEAMVAELVDGLRDRASACRDLAALRTIHGDTSARLDVKRQTYEHAAELLATHPATNKDDTP